MDRTRKLITVKAQERGLTLAELSRKAGKNHAYFQQFISRGVPSELPEKVRKVAAMILGVDERQLAGPEERTVVPIDEFERGEERPAPVGALHEGGRAFIPEGEIPQVDTKLPMGGPAADAPTIEIPAGNGSIAAVPVIDTWKIPRNVLQRRLRGAVSSLHIVECEGDSMDPRIHDGDFVFIDTSRRVPSPPGIFALNDGFGQTLKRLELVPNSEPPRVKIIPENPRHETYERHLEEVKIIGRYLCRLTMD